MSTPKEQLVFEMVEQYMAVTPLEKHPSSTQLFLFSAITRNPHRIHYDQSYAKSEDHPNVLVQGRLQGAFLGQLMTDWIGAKGVLKQLNYSVRARVTPEDTLTCRGTVTEKYEQGDEHCVACELWIENQRGEVTVQGSAVVALPNAGVADRTR